jgi:uncharacterized membrane protein (UPF0136 family)
MTFDLFAYTYAVIVSVGGIIGYVKAGWKEQNGLTFFVSII